MQLEKPSPYDEGEQISRCELVDLELWELQRPKYEIWSSELSNLKKLEESGN
jgi:hypothetical protein